MTITQFDHYNSGPFLLKAKALLEDLAREHGLTMKLRKDSHTPAALTMVFVASTPAGTAITHDAFTKRQADILGIDLSRVSPEGYRITGYNHRAPKNPWNMIDDNGKQMRAPNGWIAPRFKRIVPESKPAFTPSHPAHPHNPTMINMTADPNRYEGEF